MANDITDWITEAITRGPVHIESDHLIRGPVTITWTCAADAKTARVFGGDLADAVRSARDLDARDPFGG